MKKIRLIVGAILLLFTVMLGRTFSLNSVQVDVQPVARVELDELAIAGRLAQALQIPTISGKNSTAEDNVPFTTLLDWMESTYPAVYSNLRAERIADFSLLLTWTGRSATLAPGLFMAHLDVVPVEPGTEDDWTYPAFGGTIADGFVWGRGALDIKSGAVALHETIRQLIADGFQPERTLYFAFGHDEEIGGADGNGHIVEWMTQREIQLQFVVDEGGFLLDDLIPELGERPVALIDVAEKAYCTIHLTAKGEGGHSSMPPAHTAVGRISSAIHHLESNPFPLELSEPILAQFRALAPEMPFLHRVVLSNLWLTSSLVKAQMASEPKAMALLQTTTAATIIEGGVQENVVPQQASATVNFRLLPGTTPEDVLEHVQKIVDDPAIQAEIGLTTVPAEPSSSDSETYFAIAKSVREIHPDCVVLPTLLVGATDSRHYGSIAKEVYRFSGLRLQFEDISGFHGTNERIQVSHFADAIRILMRMVENLDH